MKNNGLNVNEKATCLTSRKRKPYIGSEKMNVIQAMAKEIVM